MMSKPLITLQDIEMARRRIAGKARRTPVIHSDALAKMAGQPVWLKLDHRQPTGSFKLRGASNAIASLSGEECKRGVTTASTGNHGRALAYAAKLEGMQAIICMSQLVPANKVSEINHLGAEARIIGRSQDDAQVEADRLVAEEGFVLVPPFDHPAVIAGQGTIGLEILEDIPDVATVVVPLSGGGLIAGIAVALKARKPDVTVIGASMTRGAAMKAREGVRHAYALEREIVEGAGAVGIAALLVGKVKSRGPIVALLSGRNIDMDLHRSIVSGETGILGKRAS